MLILLSELSKCYVDEDNEKNDYDNKKHIITTTTLTTYFNSCVCHDIDINNKKKTILYENISINDGNNVSTTLTGSSNDNKSDRDENNNNTIEIIVSHRGNDEDNIGNSNNMNINDKVLLLLLLLLNCNNCHDRKKISSKPGESLTSSNYIYPKNKYDINIVNNDIHINDPYGYENDVNGSDVPPSLSDDNNNNIDDERVLLSLWPIPGECKEKSSVEQTMSTTDNNNCIYNNTYDCEGNTLSIR